MFSNIEPRGSGSRSKWRSTRSLIRVRNTLITICTHQEFLLLPLQLLHLLGHDLVSVHLGDLVLVQLVQHLLTELCVLQLVDLVLGVLGLNRICYCLNLKQLKT